MNYILFFYPNLKNFLPENKKIIILAFLSKVILDFQKLNEINIIEALNNYNIFLNTLEDKKEIFKHIYNPISGINQLNIIYEGCILSENYEKLNEFILELTQIKLEDKKNKEEKNDNLYNQCIAQHMNYVIKNMGKTKSKSELEINYGIFLLDKILPLIVKYNKSKKAKMLLYEKVYRNKNNFIYKNKGLFSNLIYNQNIKFENKIEIFKKINSVIKIDLHSFSINTKNISVLLLYLFFNKNECFKLYKNINEGNIYQKIFDDFYYISSIYSEVYFLCDKYHKDNLNIFIQKLDNFFMNNYHDLISDYLDINNIHDLSE